ncbi:MAG: AAA family ATPase [Reichenbachiella sp.]|uniref:AAA family ATPase n=1 Tax=Reichenbachiella sp. TaxID=2184521 RepID=UPI003267B1A3
MNKEAIREIVSSKLEDVNFIENTDLLIGKHVFNQFALGTYFIDYGDHDFSFDLREYQEKYISSEYYKAPGYLQWNYYLIFLRDSYEEGEKQKIEKDGIYTRKFLFTPDEFNDYFGYQHSEKTVDSDITSVWKEKLRQVDLDESYSDAPYAQAIPRFLSDEVIKDIDTENNKSEEDKELIINNILSLNLSDTFRRHPLKRDFNLGKVNLVTGVNGTGKTSFLEAIELLIAGKSNRNPSFNEEYGCIEALYNDKFTDTYTPGKNAKYRERDRVWYSSAYKTGNELFRAFNKYNFYDSDAAYNLSHDSSAGDLNKYFSSIALGAEFNRIQDRLLGFRERLGSELRSRLKGIDEEKDRIKKSKEILENTKLASTPEESFKAFISCSKEIKWKKNLPKVHKDSFSVFTDNYQRAQSFINSLNQLLATVKLRNLHAIKNELTKLAKALKACNEYKVQLEALNERLNVKKKTFADVNSQFQILERAKKFYNDQSSFHLWNLNDRINTLSMKIKKDTKAFEYFEKLTDQDIFQKPRTFASVKSEQLSERQNLTERRKELTKQIERLKLNLSKLEQIVSEIKSYGKQYLASNKAADFCPLCETQFSFDELSSRISNIAKEADENVIIDNLNTQLIRLDNQLSRANESITNIQHIESGVSILSESEYSQLSMLEIKKIFTSSKDGLEKNIEGRSELLRLKEGLQAKGFHEDDFNNVKEELENTISEIKFISGDKAKHEELFSRVEKKRAPLLEEIKKEEEKSTELNNSRKVIIEKVAPGINFSEYESELAYRIEISQKAVRYFKDLEDYLSFSEDEDLIEISQKIDQLFKLYSNVSNSISSQKELNLANQIILKSEVKVKSLEPECKRISDGLAVIDDILENHGESKVLGDFIKNNEREIQEIFQNIHSPKEFSQIKFSEGQNSVLLKRRTDGEGVPINKISTGQRSALALSIFLALNKKLKQGPNLILFDDPVTYTDDLNILSFLDYLREMIIHENRQVVFATANQKLAGLFEKKFAFFGDDNFKKFHFER